MKRILALLLAMLMCVLLASCKDDATVSEETNTVETSEFACTEKTLRELLETNFDCYYLFYVAPISEGGGTDSDGYTKADTAFFASYSELRDFVTGTYTKEKSDYLLYEYPRPEKPLYKEKNGAVYVDLDAVEPTSYRIIWDDSYTVTFTENDNTKCAFTLTTIDLDSNEYTTSGTAVFESGNWRLTDLVY